MKHVRDLSPGDAAHRRWLLQRLRALRISLGCGLADVGYELHLTWSGVSKFENHPNPNPYICSVQRYLRALDHRADLRLRGLPDVEGDPNCRFGNSDDPAAADAAERSLLLARLLATRKALGISQFELARRLGCDRSSLCVIEQGRQEPMLGTYQRYARALGGSLRVNVVAAPPADPVAVEQVMSGRRSFSVLNDAERVLLFREHAPQLSQRALMERLGVSGTQFAQWRDRAAEVV
jgi:transcriptional regulator with XRE-family HTH domain